MGDRKQPPPTPPARKDLVGAKPFDEYIAQMKPYERRAVQRGLASLDAMAIIWGAEIKLSEVADLLARLPEEFRAERIAALMRQAFTEGAYRHYLDTTPEPKPGAIYRDEELLKRAVMNAEVRRTNVVGWRWVAVMDVFGCGSTTAQELCRRFGLNPDEIVRS